MDYTESGQSRANQGTPRFACNPALNHAGPAMVTMSPWIETSVTEMTGLASAGATQAAVARAVESRSLRMMVGLRECCAMARAAAIILN